MPIPVDRRKRHALEPPSRPDLHVTYPCGARSLRFSIGRISNPLGHPASGDTKWAQGLAEQRTESEGTPGPHEGRAGDNGTPTAIKDTWSMAHLDERAYLDC